MDTQIQGLTSCTFFALALSRWHPGYRRWDRWSILDTSPLPWCTLSLREVRGFGFLSASPRSLRATFTLSKGSSRSWVVAIATRVVGRRRSNRLRFSNLGRCSTVARYLHIRTLSLLIGR